MAFHYAHMSVEELEEEWKENEDMKVAKAYLGILPPTNKNITET
jgi:hypothetical protein